MSDWKYFKREEFACKCGCGTNEISDEFITVLDTLRGQAGFPFRISSGYRCADHPEEAKKEKPGQHHEGIAADILIDTSAQRHALLDCAFRDGRFNGVGIANTFVHLDIRDKPAYCWTY